MSISIKEIALFFSNGEFEKTNEHLNENIIWEIIGENVLEGKQAVMKNCEQTATYFKTVETHFKTTDAIVSKNRVIITGTAEFKKNGVCLNFISACDIYEFNGVNEIIRISSYCVPDKKEELLSAK